MKVINVEAQPIYPKFAQRNQDHLVRLRRDPGDSREIYVGRVPGSYIYCMPHSNQIFSRGKYG